VISGWWRPPTATLSRWWRRGLFAAIFSFASKAPYLKDVLAASRGNVKEAPRISELSPSRLYALLKKYRLTPARLNEVGY